MLGNLLSFAAALLLCICCRLRYWKEKGYQTFGGRSSVRPRPSPKGAAAKQYTVRSVSSCFFGTDGCSHRPNAHRCNRLGSFATLAAIRRASSLLSSLAAE